jgi:putative ABC transport system permease protein
MLNKKILNFMIMIKYIVKITGRKILKDRFNSFLNVLGLSVGIASFLIIFFHIINDLTYDNFHNESDRVLRVCVDAKIGEQAFNIPMTEPVLAPAIVENIPDVEATTRIYFPQGVVISKDDFIVMEDNFIYADSNFFDFFNFNLLQGDKRTVLAEPYSLILTYEKAKIYFGEENPIGKVLNFGEEKVQYKITGVLDEIPQNSHLNFDFIGSFSSHPQSKVLQWGAIGPISTYVKLNENAFKNVFDEKLQNLIREKIGPLLQQVTGLDFDKFEEQGMHWIYYTQQLEEIHLKSHFTEVGLSSVDAKYLKILGGIAIFILLIACINYINSSTARFSKYAKETGIRKVFGAQKSTLFKQFMIESIVITFIAMLFALGLVELARFPYNSITDNELIFDVFKYPWMLLVVFGLPVIIGFIAGIYPAFFISSFKPVEAFKGNFIQGVGTKSLRSILVTFQFFISISLIISTILIYKQLEFMRHRDPGYEKENMIVLRNQVAFSTDDVFFKELQNYPIVESATITETVPLIGGGAASFFTKEGSEQQYTLAFIQTDKNYLKTLKAELIKGEFFSDNFEVDKNTIVLNEAAVKELGMKEPLGKKLFFFNNQMHYTIKGIVKDFHLQEMQNEIRPIVLFLNTTGNVMGIRYTAGKEDEVLNLLEGKWKIHYPNQPLSHEFLANAFEQQFRNDKRLSNIFLILTVISIFVACLGLLGLAMFINEQRTKEIGIRKTVGAKTSALVNLLYKDLLKLNILGLILSIPVTYYFIHKWLQSFPLRTEISWWVFLLGGIITILITIITAGYHTLKTTNQNPVNSLRYE